jgi:GNAT superfamily N-acetyltransferase
MANAAITLRPATSSDAPLIFALICELAAYERLSQDLEANEAMIAKALFSEQPRTFCTIAEYDGAPAGFVLWFYTFSTFQGRHGIWIEDVFVREEFRGKGIGTALFMLLARRCLMEKLGRLEWAVLDWNETAISFYRSMGARLMQEWTMCRLDGTALNAFVEARPKP